MVYLMTLCMVGFKQDIYGIASKRNIEINYCHLVLRNKVEPGKWDLPQAHS